MTTDQIAHEAARRAREMSQDTAATHNAALQAAQRSTDNNPVSNAGDWPGEFARAYLAHLRPTIEAEAREAALREAAAICQRENWDDAAENAILALITKEPEA